MLGPVAVWLLLVWGVVRASFCFSADLTVPRAPRPAVAEPPKPRDVSPTLAEAVKRFKLPGMAAAVLRGDRLVAIGAAGVRCRGRKEPITVDDCFHLGSDTKSMTATLIAQLVEEGRLKWDTSPATVFTGIGIRGIDPSWKRVTLVQLLTHRAGLASNPDLLSILLVRVWPPTPRQQRIDFCRTVLHRPPPHAPGKDYLYSNTGYIIAGAMAEAVTNRSWEELMRERLFVPLGMRSAGFGPPGIPTGGSSAKRTVPLQPWGHLEWGDPVPPGPGADNPAGYGPAGTVHLSMGDWAKYAAIHLAAERSDRDSKSPGVQILSRDSLQKLHRPIGGAINKNGTKYAMGWGVQQPSSTAGPILGHFGSNTLWVAAIAIHPRDNIAVMVATNQGGQQPTLACRDMLKALAAPWIALAGQPPKQ